MRIDDILAYLQPVEDLMLGINPETIPLEIGIINDALLIIIVARKTVRAGCIPPTHRKVRILRVPRIEQSPLPFPLLCHISTTPPHTPHLRPSSYIPSL